MALEVLAQRAPTVFPLSQDQKSLFDLYTSGNFSERVSRDYLFIAENAPAQASLRDRALTGFGIGGLLGGVVGGLGGSSHKISSWCGSSGGFIG